MKNIKKSFIKFATILIVFFGAVFAKTGVQQCHRDMAKHEVENEVKNATLEIFEKEAFLLCKQCPTNIDSFTKLQSIEIDGKQYTMKITVDDEYVDMFSVDGYKEQMINLFKKRCKGTDKFEEILKEDGIQFTILVYSQNGELKHTIEI